MGAGGAPDHPRTDPGDGRAECDLCGKFVWAVTHSCKGTAPVLTDPGYGRTWVPQPFKVCRQTRGAFVLLSRTGTLIGIVAEYDNGWGADAFIGGKRKTVGYDGYPTAQAAAGALLKARRAKR